MSSFAERAAQVQKIRRALRKEFGKQTPEASSDLGLTLLRFIFLEESDPQTVEDAVKKIEQGFVDLNEFRVSFPAEVAEIVPQVPHVQRKASRLAQLFNAMFLRHNTMKWDVLRSLGVRELRQYFEKIDGGDAVLGAAAVMLLSSGHAVPADADVRRVLSRLGLIEEGEDMAALQGFLERALSRDEGYETWALLHRLGEKVCLPGEPLCAKCLLKTLCPTGRQRLTAKPKPAAAKGGKKAAAGPAAVQKSVAKKTVGREKPKAAAKSKKKK